MTDENEKLPSDAEDGGLKPQPPKDREPSTPSARREEGREGPFTAAVLIGRKHARAKQDDARGSASE